LDKSFGITQIGAGLPIFQGQFQFIIAYVPMVHHPPVDVAVFGLDTVPWKAANPCSKRSREGMSRWLIGSSSSKRLQPAATSLARASRAPLFCYDINNSLEDNPVTDC